MKREDVATIIFIDEDTLMEEEKITMGEDQEDDDERVQETIGR